MNYTLKQYCDVANHSNMIGTRNSFCKLMGRPFVQAGITLLTWVAFSYHCILQFWHDAETSSTAANLTPTTNELSNLMVELQHDIATIVLESRAMFQKQAILPQPLNPMHTSATWTKSWTSVGLLCSIRLSVITLKKWVCLIKKVISHPVGFSTWSLCGSMSNPPLSTMAPPEAAGSSRTNNTCTAPPNSQTPLATKNLVTRDLDLVLHAFSQPPQCQLNSPNRRDETTLPSHAQGWAILSTLYSHEQLTNCTSIGLSPDRREGLQEVF